MNNISYIEIIKNVNIINKYTVSQPLKILYWLTFYLSSISMLN